MQQPDPSAEHKRWVMELQSKHERRIYDRLVDRKNADMNYFQRQSDGGMREMEKTVSFAMTFIFSFWLAGVTGFCLGRYFFGWEQVASMKLAIAFIVMTIMVETGLFIIKVTKMTDVEMRKRKSETRRYPTFAGKESSPVRSNLPAENPTNKKKQ